MVPVMDLTINVIVKAGTITLIVLHLIKQEASATLTTVEEGITFLRTLVTQMHQ